jgi:predicted amidophosphoribosyltransferase
MDHPSAVVTPAEAAISGSAGVSGTGRSGRRSRAGDNSAATTTTTLLEGAYAVPPLGANRRQAGGYGVCCVCHGPAAEGLAWCWSCRRVCSQLGAPVPVVPLFLFSLGSSAHRALVGYKAAASAAARSAKGAELEVVLAAFFDDHMTCVVKPPCRSVVVVPVPSTTGGRPSWGGRHPVARLAETVLDRRRDARGGFDVSLAEVLGVGGAPPRRLEARADGFEVLPECGGRLSGATVIVLDDVLTSGARALSAAAALGRAGADVAAVVPIGRLVRPDHSRATAAFWAACSRRPWHPDTCAACGPKRVAVAMKAAPAAVTASLAA